MTTTAKVKSDYFLLNFILYFLVGGKKPKLGILGFEHGTWVV